MPVVTRSVAKKAKDAPGTPATMKVQKATKVKKAKKPKKVHEAQAQLVQDSVEAEAEVQAAQDAVEAVCSKWHSYEGALDQILNRAKCQENLGIVPELPPPGKGDAFSDIPFDSRLTVEDPTRPYRNGGVIDEEFFFEKRDGTLVKIADESVFPKYHPSLLRAPDELYSDAVFVKRPNWTLVDFALRGITMHNPFFEEAVVMSELAKRPHPHIVRFLGCRVRRGRITGLVLERLQCSLENIDQSLFSQIILPHKAKFFERLYSAVAHLHALGFVHNDLKPGNVMLRADGQPVLIDFDTCRPNGAFMDLPGTTGWTRPEMNVLFRKGIPIYAQPANDLYSIDLLEHRFTVDGLQPSYEKLTYNE